MTTPSSAPIVVTGANGLVGSRVVAALVERGATVRAVVRRAGAAPERVGVEEWVGEFDEPAFAASVVEGAAAVVSTVHPMGSDLETQRRIGVEGTATLARVAADAGVERFVHVSTAAVYDREPGDFVVDESAPLVPDTAAAYPLTKRDADAALAGIEGITRVVLRPPQVFGAGETSTWNTKRPAAIRSDERARHTVPEATLSWVHVDDLAAFAADLATGAVATADDPQAGPVPGGFTAVNVAAEPAQQREYFETVARAVGVEPVWDDRPAWTGHISAERARAWGWHPAIGLPTALAEIEAGLRA
ncbi:NAD(P)-dependent oxidoreductase [Nocardioides sp. cx-169]|uniref:NAD-dependent epimerase/dehydratase family protein n=1 Tax=Nocardioides sp. cx-169 TaxID=2899080 RepID=UPI001E5DE0CA|nr:NAD(P)-dependent oxidoreductase [Nocardioides sp. cx-169]MCD4532841.1 NAD(P)-dependent oxidoreductase [Nocardioides sp. cx-169]